MGKAADDPLLPKSTLDYGTTPPLQKGGTSLRRTGSSEQVPHNLKKRLFFLLEHPESSWRGQLVGTSLMLIILVSTVAFVLESEVCDSPDCSGFLPFEPWSMIFYIIELVCVVIFTIEYCLRFWSCGDDWAERWQFACKPLNFIDLIAWLPFWITGFFTDPPFGPPAYGHEASSVSLSFVRVVRLVRIFRIIKLGRYSAGLRMYVGTLKLSAQPLLVLVLASSVATVIFASVIWLIERPDSGLVTAELLASTGRGDSDGVRGLQAMCFGTIPSAFWWTLTTMTTVGYGDCFPITLLGKIFGTIVMFSGIIVFALPISVVGNNFTKMTSLLEAEQAQFSTSDFDRDGRVDYGELKEWMKAKRHENLLRDGVETSPRAVMQKYDPKGLGYLLLDQFKQEQRDLLVEPRDPAAEAVEKLQLEMRARMDAQDERVARLEAANAEVAAKIDQLCAALLTQKRK